MNSANSIKRSHTESNLDAKEKHRRKAEPSLRSRAAARVMGSPAPGCRSTPAQKHSNQSRPAPAATRVTARIDVGFGNSLFIRGEGNGLSWEYGQPLTCVDGAAWVWSSPSASEESTFKLLLNDQVWCQGENFRVAPGSQLEIAPHFGF